MPILVLDPNQRVLASFSNEDAAERAKRFVDGLELFTAPTRPRDTAPVLLVPRVFEPEFCDELISAFHARGHEASGVYSLIDGNPVHAVDASVKRRLDHYVRDDDLTNAIKRRIGARLLPEIEKAFCFRVTRLEEFKITCYRSSDRGVFKPHRDNHSPQTLHRRFALTLNLNDNFEGGELRFPEYGAHLYRPRRGEAIVFSCSLLHEALEVDHGDRYVLVAFMYDDAGAAQKRAMQERLAGDGERAR
jgi:predicted 2-oxoglutarate/Fe(II)-dependent dioxygenase YbiX